MPRIRSLKPDFFTSEQIVSVSIPARYLFEGIWVFGDDEGYIAHSPIQLKMRIFPGDSVDVPELIGELLGVGLVQEVDTDQGAALWVPSFRNHQSPKYPTPTKYTVDGRSLTQHSPTTGEHVRKRSPRTHPGEERRGEERSREEIEEREQSSSEAATAAPRPEIDALLDLLDSEIRRNGGKVPSRTKKNHDAIRLMLDRDGHTATDIAGCIRWCQADEFWRSNILSASKLREKYDQLRLAAQRKQGGPKQSKASQNADEYRRLFGGDEGSVPALDPGIG